MRYFLYLENERFYNSIHISFSTIFLKYREQNYFLFSHKKNTPHLPFTFPYIIKILFFYFYFN
jgi:hypothetical protein